LRLLTILTIAVSAAALGPMKALAFVEQPARNCELASPPNTGENAAHGFLSNQVEITFCGNRRLSTAELQQFIAAEHLTLVTISSNAAQTQNAYYFQIGAGASVVERVRQLAGNPDVRSVGVVPLGVPTSPSTGPAIGTLPSTSTSATSLTIETHPVFAYMAGGVGLAIFVLLARRRHAQA
jgi:hypothetical protein